MGKKVKKTRWRALALNGHRSDSEESCTLHGDNFQRKYSKFSYSSHSSPVRKFEDRDVVLGSSTKSTRSNSATSEKKATFNEDEYTRITTPRQDVLFKKGYLNKPKVYQQQTSTGTCSTANSTSTCTPDHQSADGMEGTDVEYESQFVFPNGFIDQNGIYYINSFEPFPFVVYNPPICYTEHPNARTKRYSTDSMAESVSPQNEESGVTNVSTQPSDEEQPVRLKKRRRRKVSPSKSVTSEASSDDVFKTEEQEAQTASNKYELKPDAEEFIPRNLHAENVPFDPSIHFFNIQPNFIPVPFMNGEPFVPVNFVPPAPNYVNVIPEPAPAEVKTEPVETKKKTDIDIAKIVWKLEEAAKEQEKKPYNRLAKGRPFQRPRFNHCQNREPDAKWKPKPADLPTPVKPIEKKTEIKVNPSPVRTPRKSNQWIAVANRKKRKNKPADETPPEEVIEEIQPLNDDLFESFDINQLVDVVPPSQMVTEPESVALPEPDIGKLAPVEDPAPTPEIKKKKKKTSKIVMKKIIITDFSTETESEPAPEQNQTIEEPTPPITSEVLPAPNPTVEENVPELQPIISDTPEKKKKKKKKPVASSPKSISNTTLNCDDSYDFLLETSALDEFDKKTNVEISRELDRMIQKGMYSNLEEKVRAMNLDLDESFFEIVAKSESRPASNGGIFPWNMRDFQDKGEDNQSTPISFTNVQNFSVPSEPILSEAPSSSPPPTHFPITRAVREWMTKTRENTPDIEIFKSPNTIYKQFCDEDDDDVVLWSASEVETEPNCKIEDCEEAIEVYESCYGNNDDYLSIKSEIEAQKNNHNFAPHSDLPYRAICCNLM